MIAVQHSLIKHDKITSMSIATATSKTATLFLLVFGFFFLAQPISAQTADWRGVCVAGELGDRGADVATLQGLECLLGNFLSVILAIIGLAAFVMLIIGAFRWMTSGSNPKGAETARNTITFAVIGIVVALSGFIVLNLLSSFTGIDLTEFVIPGSDTGVDPLQNSSDPDNY